MGKIGPKRKGPSRREQDKAWKEAKRLRIVSESSQEQAAIPSIVNLRQLYPPVKRRREKHKQIPVLISPRSLERTRALARREKDKLKQSPNVVDHSICGTLSLLHEVGNLWQHNVPSDSSMQRIYAAIPDAPNTSLGNTELDILALEVNSRNKSDSSSDLAVSLIAVFDNDLDRGNSALDDCFVQGTSVLLPHSQVITNPTATCYPIVSTETPSSLLPSPSAKKTADDNQLSHSVVCVDLTYAAGDARSSELFSANAYALDELPRRPVQPMTEQPDNCRPFVSNQYTSQIPTTTRLLLSGPDLVSHTETEFNSSTADWEDNAAHRNGLSNDQDPDANAQIAISTGSKHLSSNSCSAAQDPNSTTPRVTTLKDGTVPDDWKDIMTDKGTKSDIRDTLVDKNPPLVSSSSLADGKPDQTQRLLVLSNVQYQELHASSFLLAPSPVKQPKDHGMLNVETGSSNWPAISIDNGSVISKSLATRSSSAVASRPVLTSKTTRVPLGPVAVSATKAVHMGSAPPPVGTSLCLSLHKRTIVHDLSSKQPTGPTSMTIGQYMRAEMARRADLLTTLDMKCEQEDEIISDTEVVRESENHSMESLLEWLWRFLV